MNLRIIVIAALLPAIFLALPACKSKAQKEEEASWRMDTPLPHDPTDKFELGPWWSNGRQLLNLQTDGFYALYDNNNRYSKPLERGRWSQQSYAVLWLEPYSQRSQPPTRVGITKMDDRLALALPKFKPMFALAAAPAVNEDTLIGDWQGPMGSLRLNADMTYTFTPSSGGVRGGMGSAGGAGTIIASHSGRWRLGKDLVMLTPTTPSIAPLMLKVHAAPPAATQPQGGAKPSATEPVLEGLGGELVKVKAASA